MLERGGGIDGAVFLGVPIRTETPIQTSSSIAPWPPGTLTSRNRPPLTPCRLFGSGPLPEIPFYPIEHFGNGRFCYP